MLVFSLFGVACTVIVVLLLMMPVKGSLQWTVDGGAGGHGDVRRDGGGARRAALRPIPCDLPNLDYLVVGFRVRFSQF